MVFALMQFPRYSATFAKTPALLLVLLVFTLSVFSTAYADNPTFDGTTLRGPNNITSVVLETRIPNQTANAEVTVWAHTPPGETTARFPGQPYLTGFKFVWPTSDQALKKELIGNTWVATPKAAQGTVTVTPNRVGYTADNRLFPFSAANEADGVGTRTETAIVTAKFPQPGRYRVEIGVIANWWSGTKEEWEGESEVLPLDMNVLNVQKLQYRSAQNGVGQGEFADLPDPFIVSLNQQIEFQAVANPSGVNWVTEAETNKPQWSSTGTGVTGATGKADSKVVTFTALGDKSVTAAYGNEKTVNVKVVKYEMTFTGLARACAGGIAVDGTHDFTITGIAKTSDGALAPNTDYTFSFENNRGHNYKAGERADNKTGILHRAKFLPDTAQGQVAVPNTDGEAMTAKSNAQGQISIHVLGSDIISADIKIVAKWKSAGEVENVAGTQLCQFAPTKSFRGFTDLANPNQSDNGWLFNIQRLRYNDETGNGVPIKDTATASVYLQYKIDYNGNENASNYERVNGHEMLFAVDNITGRLGKTILPDKNLYVQLTPTRPDGATFGVSKRVGTYDGVAQGVVKSGPKVSDAETIPFIAYDQSQWSN